MHDRRAPELPDGRVSDLKIVVTPGEVQNTYLLRTNRTDVIGFWDLGNGNTASGVNSVTAEYPFPGDYTISLKAYGDNGRTNDVSVKLSVTTENLFLLNDPMYTYIAGEIGGEGKTWMLDAERQDHIGLFNPNNVSDRWWGVSPNGKAGCELYDDEATFILNSERGQAFGYVNNGKSSTLNNMTPAMELYNDGAWSATAYNLASTNDYIVAWYGRLRTWVGVFRRREGAITSLSPRPMPVTAATSSISAAGIRSTRSGPSRRPI